MNAGSCSRCGEESDDVAPLRFDAGGPLVCMPCGDALFAEESDTPEVRELAVGRAVLERFNRHNRERQAQANALRALIEAIPDAQALTADEMRLHLKSLPPERLGRALPSERTIRRHLAAIRRCGRGT